MKKVTLVLAALLCSLSFSASASWWNWWKTPSGYTDTKHPIVLVHGILGFDTVIGMEYWYRIPSTLKKEGAEVYVTQVTALDSTEARGEQLIEQLEAIIALSGAEKVNLLGHSHGGVTSRYVASVRPDLIASVTNIAGPTFGSPVADAILDLDSPIRDVVLGGMNALGTLINALSNNPSSDRQDALASLTSFTQAESTRFNTDHPYGVPTTSCGAGERYAANGIQYFSFGGASPLTNLFDPTDLLFVTTSLAFDKGVKNDGLVSSCSSHLGMIIRDDYGMNHLDEVNMMLGLHSIFETDPLTVYRQHANRLKNAGL
jgi:triacylglycerol lipase